VRAIFWKELNDHLGRRRFALLFAMVLIGVLWGVFITLREVTNSGARSTDDFLFLQMFTSSSGVLPSLLFFVSFFGPIIGIALGFDAINSERTQGTLSRILSQPVFRDAVFNGKLLAGLAALTIVFVSMMLSIIGFGMFFMGFPPTGEEVLRLIGFGLLAIAYLAFWLSLAMTCSVFLRNAVASALVAIGIWVVTAFVVVLVSSAIADVVVPEIDTTAEALKHFNITQWISRLSPGQLFQEATKILLDPGVERSLTPLVLLGERLGGLLATPISAGQSLQLVWPHIVALVSGVALLLGLSYTKFMREEIRS
jgi:ABC-2 type transport system permease protein